MSAAETRVQFLQEEVSQINDKNVLLQDKILSIIQQSTKEITTLRKALSGKEENAVKERMELQCQHEGNSFHYSYLRLRAILRGFEDGETITTHSPFFFTEAIQHLQVQQAYIEDLDKFVNERMEENQEVSKQVQDFATQVAQETEQTLQVRKTPSLTIRHSLVIISCCQ